MSLGSHALGGSGCGGPGFFDLLVLGAEHSTFG